MGCTIDNFDPRAALQRVHDLSIIRISSQYVSHVVIHEYDVENPYASLVSRPRRI